MPYATKQNLIDQFTEAALFVVADADGDGTLDAEDEARIAKALADATATVDSYLAAKYTLPLSEVPPIVTRICGDIAYYFLASQGRTPAEETRLRYTDAIRWLKDISTGAAALGGAATPPSSGTGSPEFSGPDRAFSRDRMGDL